MKTCKHEDILNFWFGQLSPEDWFKKNPNLDHQITDSFLEVYQKAAQGELFIWRESMEGRLAEIIVLDQFPRNMFRDHPKSFQHDSLALILSQEACDLPAAKELPSIKRAFLYMPFMHSESLVVHNKAVELFSENGLEKNLEFELKHKTIIERFGRYPHRNQILDRESTLEEIEFLKGPGSSF